jgi:hypothetical protein
MRHQLPAQGEQRQLLQAAVDAEMINKTARTANKQAINRSGFLQSMQVTVAALTLLRHSLTARTPPVLQAGKQQQRHLCPHVSLPASFTAAAAALLFCTTPCVCTTGVLQAGKVPVPRPLCMCSDASVIGTPFYVMQFAGGTIFTNPNLPDVGPR